MFSFWKTEKCSKNKNTESSISKISTRQKVHARQWKTKVYTRSPSVVWRTNVPDPVLKIRIAQLGRWLCWEHWWFSYRICFIRGPYSSLLGIYIIIRGLNLAILVVPAQAQLGSWQGVPCASQAQRIIPTTEKGTPHNCLDAIKWDF